MGNMLSTAICLPCHPKNRGGQRKAEQIKYLCYHYTGNEGDKAVNNAKYYQNTVVQASAHYFVDDGEIYQSVEDLQIAWSVGGKKWADCPQTGGGRLYGVATNGNSISIEMCGTARNGQRMASEATLQRAAELGRELMEKYHIPIERVVRHFDVTGKHCPAYLMDAGAWAAFKVRLSGAPGASRPTGGDGYDTAAGASPRPTEKMEMKMYHYVKDMPEWAREACTKAIHAGVVNMDASGAVNIWESNLQPLVWLDRAGLLDQAAER